MTTLPLETSALVVEFSNAGFKRMPITLTSMRPDELLIEMKFSGICHTDIVASQGHYPSLTYPCVLGHEGAGVIRAVGSNVKNPGLKIGTAVLLSFNHCGNCKNCESDHPACCSSFEYLNITARHLDDSSTCAKLSSDGRDIVTQFFGQSSLSRHSIVSQNSVVVCPEADPENLSLYAPLGCGFQTGAGTILNALKPRKEDSIAIFGAGAVGLAAVMAAKYLGIEKVIVIDLVDEKLELAKELGATHTIKGGGGDIVERIHEVTDCEGVRYAIDCTGVSSVLENIQDCVACGGTVVIVGSPKPDFVMKIPLSQFLHVNKTVRGICQGDSIPEKFIPEMIELHRAGRFPIEKLCKVYSINDIDLAVADVRAGKTIKPVLKWEWD